LEVPIPWSAVHLKYLQRPPLGLTDERDRDHRVMKDAPNVDLDRQNFPQIAVPYTLNATACFCSCAPACRR